MLMLPQWALYFGGRIIYNIYWHPLAKFPGPKLRSATFAPYYWAVWLGREPISSKKLHDRYGPVVRINPNTLSFITAQAWKDIFGIRPGRIQLPKNYVLAEKGRTRPIISIIDDAGHARVRTLLSPAFSERAMREQESLIMGYIDLLIQRLKAQIQGPTGGQVDLVRWYNFTTFDIIGDLALGQPFGSLESGKYHVWISNIFRRIKRLSWLSIMMAYPILEAILTCVVRLYPKAMEGQRLHREYAKVAMEKRLATKTDKKDFLSYLSRPKDERGLTIDEIDANAALLIIAGSETSATALSGLTYHLLTNKTTLEKVCNEVRSAFKSEGETTFTSVARLPYLNAVIEESFRIYPPVPSALSRFTLSGGNVIDGHSVPGNVSYIKRHLLDDRADQALQTIVGISQWATNRSKNNFRDPDRFVPERWLDDPAYADDQRAAVQTFSIGPRNCIGQT